MIWSFKERDNKIKNAYIVNAAICVYMDIADTKNTLFSRLERQPVGFKRAYGTVYLLVIAYCILAYKKTYEGFRPIYLCVSCSVHQFICVITANISSFLVGNADHVPWLQDDKTFIYIWISFSRVKLFTESRRGCQIPSRRWLFLHFLWTGWQVWTDIAMVWPNWDEQIYAHVTTT